MRGSLEGAAMSNETLVPRQFHLLSFEGPDLYARAGGVATRVVGLAEELASRGFDTHLWFVGDPSEPGVLPCIGAFGRFARDALRVA